MKGAITLLKSANGQALVKSFSGKELFQQPFTTGKLFNVSEEPVSDLKSLSNVLQRLEKEPTNTIISGSLVDGQPGAVRRTKEIFAATHRPLWPMHRPSSATLTVSWDTTG